MIRRPTMPTVAAVMAAMALLTAGCSSGGSHEASNPVHHPVQQDSDSNADHDSDSDADSEQPAVPGEPGEEDEDEDAAAPLNPNAMHGTKITTAQVKGYTAYIDVLKLPSIGPEKKPWTEMLKPHPIKDVNGGDQGPAQTAVPTAKAPKLQVNVAGLDFAHWGAGHPPDTSGAIGPKQYVQTVNTSIGIYDKSGKQLNAFRFNTFFSQFHTGTPCDTQNGGDPQVIFDQPSNHWIVADLSYPSGGPYYFCMAVSDGSSITDKKWTLYPYIASEDSLNDYPKIASGPNGLFLTSNMFYHFQSFSGAEVWAFERSSLGSKKLQVQTVRTSAQYGGLLPANSYATKESKGPDYLVSLEDTSHIGLWKYTVNWKNPKKSKFTQTPTLVQVDPYQPASSVPAQGGSPMDTLSDRPMYQLQQAPDGTLWFNHSVQVGSQAGVRWYQIGNVDSKPKVLQQSTFLPKDGLSRWMGSLAVDDVGNMAVGYSVSSSTSFPSINYATRLADDPKNKLTAEGKIAKGKGAQTGTNRWGDYSQMSLDPTDHCTFWYTTEYYLATGGDWQTQIASFKFPDCK